MQKTIEMNGKKYDLNLKVLIEIERLENKNESYKEAGDLEKSAMMLYVITMSQKGAESISFDDFMSDLTIEDLEAFGEAMAEKKQ